MNKAKVIGAIISLTAVMPIWFYLLHEVLERVGATDLMWFLYWVYIPAALVGAIIARIAEE